MSYLNQMIEDTSAPPNPFDETQDRLDDIFFPHRLEKTIDLQKSGGRFVHYTTAEVAASILKNREIWMRDTRTMNDFMEISHGVDCLANVLEGPVGQHFKSLLEECYPGVHSVTTEEVDQWLPSIRSDTHLFCVSEHCSAEDRYGRLSMWRAYGGLNGVALVFRGDVMFSKTDVLHAYAMPVRYESSQGLANYFAKLNERIESDIEFLKLVGREAVETMLFALFRFCVVCTKHPAFLEEKEWRVIASPSMHPSPHLKTSIECIKGVPQKVLKLTLQDMSKEGLDGLSLPELLDRVIIGPCIHPDVVFDSLCHLMTEAGILDAKSRISFSNVPLRTS
jgi:hypothetical protein